MYTHTHRQVEHPIKTFLLTFNPVAFTLSGLSVEAIVAMDRNVT